MALKLNQIQIALIGAAAQRDDRFFAAPEGRWSAAARRAVSQLLAAGLARELPARGEAPIWRRDNDSQSAFALKLTAAGVKAVAASAVALKLAAKRDLQGEVEVAARRDERPAESNPKAITKPQTPAAIAAPRAGSKIDSVVKLLGRPEGATLAVLVEATGWLPHTTYAALTGLRKRGYVLVRSRDDGAGSSVYRLAPPTREEA